MRLVAAATGEGGMEADDARRAASRISRSYRLYCAAVFR